MRILQLLILLLLVNSCTTEQPPVPVSPSTTIVKKYAADKDSLAHLLKGKDREVDSLKKELTKVKTTSVKYQRHAESVIDGLIETIHSMDTITECDSIATQALQVVAAYRLEKASWIEQDSIYLQLVKGLEQKVDITYEQLKVERKESADMKQALDSSHKENLALRSTQQKLEKKLTHKEFWNKLWKRTTFIAVLGLVIKFFILP